MTLNDGSQSMRSESANSGEVEDSLVEALGFEPTSAVSLETTEELSPKASWLPEDESDPVGGKADQDAKGKSTFTKSGASTNTDTDSVDTSADNLATRSDSEVADSKMSPPKRKGKGPKVLLPEDNDSGSQSDDSSAEGVSSTNDANKTARLAKTTLTDTANGKSPKVSDGGAPTASNPKVVPSPENNIDSGMKSFAKAKASKPPTETKPSGSAGHGKGFASSKKIPSKAKSANAASTNGGKSKDSTARSTAKKPSVPAMGRAADVVVPAAGRSSTAATVDATTTVNLKSPQMAKVGRWTKKVSVKASQTAVAVTNGAAKSLSVDETSTAASVPASGAVKVDELSTSDPTLAAGVATSPEVRNDGVGAVAYGVPVTSPPVAMPGQLGTNVGQTPVGHGARQAGARIPQLLEDNVLRRSNRVRARKVRRVVRHIDPWSVLTFSVLFHLSVYAALLLASRLVWGAADAAGTIENLESFIQELGDYETYEIDGTVVAKAAAVIAGILTLASTVMMVLLTVVFNLISDIVGGIRMTVIEEETVRVRRRRNPQTQ